jgi:hypothetical protein
MLLRVQAKFHVTRPPVYLHPLLLTAHVNSLLKSYSLGWVGQQTLRGAKHCDPGTRDARRSILWTRSAFCKGIADVGGTGAASAGPRHEDSSTPAQIGCVPHIMRAVPSLGDLTPSQWPRAAEDAYPSNVYLPVLAVLFIELDGLKQAR